MEGLIGSKRYSTNNHADEIRSSRRIRVNASQSVSDIHGNGTVSETIELEQLVLSPLPRSFFAHNTVEVARDLLGKVVVVSSPDGFSAGRIVETEAYRGEDDLASHSARGPTPRSALMYGEPGTAYVYLIYGMYTMLNFITEPEGTAGGVLIRALEPLAGMELMKKRRNSMRLQELACGPGRLCQALGISMEHKGEPLQGPKIFVCDDGYRPAAISQSARVGIKVAVEHPWRFFITDSKHVSPVKENRSAKSLI
jgi:DNA-3-methyladenine glycosylase